MSKPKDHVVSGVNADGEFICVYGTEEHKPAPLPDINYAELAKCEVLPSKLPTFPRIEIKPTFIDYIVIGFVSTIMLAYYIFRALAVFIAAVVAAVIIGVGIAYLTGY